MVLESAVAWILLNHNMRTVGQETKQLGNQAVAEGRARDQAAEVLKALETQAEWVLKLHIY